MKIEINSAECKLKAILGALNMEIADIENGSYIGQCTREFLDGRLSIAKKIVSLLTEEWGVK